LVATAAYIDIDFEQKALHLLTQHDTYVKSIVPLGEILGAEHGAAKRPDQPRFLSNGQAILCGSCGFKIGIEA